METLKRLGLLVGLSVLLVACGTEDADTGVDAENTDAEVTVEEVSENVELQTEVWEEVDEETGEEFEVTLVKHVEGGKVIRSSESRELISESGEVSEEDDTEEVAPTEVSEEDIEDAIRITTIEGDEVTITNKDGEVIEELTLEEYEGTEEE